MGPVLGLDTCQGHQSGTSGCRSIAAEMAFACADERGGPDCRYACVLVPSSVLPSPPLRFPPFPSPSFPSSCSWEKSDGWPNSLARKALTAIAGMGGLWEWVGLGLQTQWSTQGLMKVWNFPRLCPEQVRLRDHPIYCSAFTLWSLKEKLNAPHLKPQSVWGFTLCL